MDQFLEFIKLRYATSLMQNFLLIMRLLEVVIPKITFKFGANNFTFIRVRLG